MALLNVTPYDRAVYERELKTYLPPVMIDCHCHIWKASHVYKASDAAKRSCDWPGMVASENTIEDLNETNRLLYPDNRVISVLYGQTSVNTDIAANNAYVAEAANANGFAALYISHPEQSAESVEQNVLQNPCYKGLKVYLEFAPSYIPNAEIRILDFLPREHLALANKHHWVVQVHIPRPGRLADPVNYVQLAEIEQQYPDLQLVVAHLGRAYAVENVGAGLDYLKHTVKTVWDFTANTNETVMQRVLEYFGPDRFLYGTDFPIFRMKARRVVEDGGFYINQIPQDSLGNVSSDPHMREIPYPAAERITFFIYEEILACKRATEALGLTREDVAKIFYGNAARIFGIG